MTMHPQVLYVIPAETERVARAAFPKPSASMRIRDELGMRFDDRDFALLFPTVGQPAVSPSRLMLITIFQFMEGLTDRPAADAVRRAIDWKYARALALTDPGCDFAVRCEFRDRRLAAEPGPALRTHRLAAGRTRGLVHARGKHRTDAPHVLAAIRTLNRRAWRGETVAPTLHQLLWHAPAWARATIPADWSDRSAPRFAQFRLPPTPPTRQALAEAIGTDGRQLRRWVAAPSAPAVVQTHPAGAILRQIGIQQFYAAAEPIRLRSAADLPPAALRIGSP